MEGDETRLSSVEGHLELNQEKLRSGEELEICILGHWLPGTLDSDGTGWYLMTTSQVGIRLRSGLAARRAPPHPKVPEASFTTPEKNYTYKPDQKDYYAENIEQERQPDTNR